MFNDWDKIDQLLKKHKLPQFTEYERDKMNNHIIYQSMHKRQWQIQYTRVNHSQKTITERNFLSLIKSAYQKLATNIILNSEKMCFPFKIRNKAGWLPLPLLFNIVLGSSSQCNKARKGNRRHTDHKGENKTVLIFKCHNYQQRKFPRSLQKKKEKKKIPDLIVEFGKVLEYN